MNRRFRSSAARRNANMEFARQIQEAQSRYAPPTIVHRGTATTLVHSRGTTHAWICACGASSRGKDFQSADEMLASLQAHVPAGTECDYSVADVTQRSA